ncbi:general vesicular transport factor p115-like [Oppia nitens]|uniref:general vesicular transport factor p115-like n=1 Tax=Oppia nitens TaxID=1686743 RepID=UPI0023DA339E|nr:general vesicular transport factor p115-like [Oppia nitens]
MDFFKSGWNSVVGSNPDTSQPTVAETVERLVERVESSTLLEDRRDACRALKSLSKTYRLEVGAQAMDALTNVLQNDSTDTEIMSYAIDTLNYVISGSMDDIQDNTVNASSGDSSPDLGVQFTEIFIKRKQNVSLLLELLAEYDFKVRWPTVKLLIGLLKNKLRDCQDCILAYPMGVSRLMDLLADSREVIRNDALLLLVHLTRSNANIQKIVAFENAFDKLLEIVAQEGYSDGGVVVEDCLIVLQNLLKLNSSNQNFFKEGSYIQRLLPFLDIPNASVWSAQKATNLLFMLRVMRTLVSPNNPLQVTTSCQKVMQQRGLLEKLCFILMASGIPADILTETINAVSEVIRGNHTNQEYFSTVNAPTVPPKPAIVVLLMSMVNEKQPFELRCAVLYCFECFLYKNELGQAQIVQTLLPSSTEVVAVTAGQLLCGGLFSPDGLSNWFVSVALGHALVDNTTQKEQLLRVQLATEVSSAPISLLKHCSTILQTGGNFQKRISLLMLLCTWLSHCPLAVSHFLSIPTNIPYLTSQVGLVEGDDLEILIQGICAFLLGICIHFNDNSVPSFTKEDLCQLIVKRIGLEIFLDKLGFISKSESYSQAVQKPQLSYKRTEDVIFDYEFCRLFKSLEGLVIKSLQLKSTDLTNGPESNMTVDEHRLLNQYKEVIREQDQQLTVVRREFGALKEEHSRVLLQLQEQSSHIQQLKDQNSLLKAQKTASHSSLSNTAINLCTNESQILDINPENNNNCEEHKLKIENLIKDLQERDNTIAALKNDFSIKVQESQAFISQEIQTESPANNEILLNENKELQELVTKLKSDLQISESNSSDNDMTIERQQLESELETLRKEQEDLLVLLTDQDSKLGQYKKRLKELGETVEDDDDNYDIDDLDIN